jgi:uncharacterized repeat protein (TIGR03803 family)
LAACIASIALASAEGGIVFTNLYSFAGTNGNLPLGRLVQAADGSLYGTTRSGGAFNNGTVFQISTNGTLVMSIPFAGTNGAVPYAGLVLGTDGNFYGTTRQGVGYGNVFRMTPDGVISNLCAFRGGGSDGILPQAALVEAANGDLYGTAYQGGILDAGTVFKITTNGFMTTLVQFTGFSGAYTGGNPLASLVVANDGNFYGTTSQGNQGTVFRMTAGGGFTNLASFKPGPIPNDGYILRSALVQGADRRLYGTAAAGGTIQGFGTVFAVTTNGTVTTLVRFGGTNGSNPYAELILASDENFYGTTSQGGSAGWNGPGTIFRMTPNGVLTTLVSFTGTNGPFAGANPQASLVQGSDGHFYGTTSAGGSYNAGTVFRLTVPLVPRIQSALRADGSFVLSWNSVAGQYYQLQSTSDLNTITWTNIGGSIIATNGRTSASVSIGENAQSFYRVVLLQEGTTSARGLSQTAIQKSDEFIDRLE